MFASQNHRPDFADTRAAWAGSESTLGLAGLGRVDAADLVEQFDQAEAADRRLLIQVLCVAGATLALALASSLI